jgi:uncharacterized protein YndB with AHSA1/START domain
MDDLTCEIVIDAQPETVFPFLTDPAKHGEWLGSVVDLDARPGGAYRVLVGDNHEAAGEFVEVVANERVVFTFGWDLPDHPIPAGSTTITITLIPDGEKTRVQLVHSGLPADAITDHRGGWDHFLGRLAIVATGGDPGPHQVPATD